MRKKGRESFFIPDHRALRRRYNPFLVWLGREPMQKKNCLTRNFWEDAARAWEQIFSSTKWHKINMIIPKLQIVQQQFQSASTIYLCYVLNFETFSWFTIQRNNATVAVVSWGTKKCTHFQGLFLKVLHQKKTRPGRFVRSSHWSSEADNRTCYILSSGPSTTIAD